MWRSQSPPLHSLALLLTSLPQYNYHHTYTCILFIALPVWSKWVFLCYLCLTLVYLVLHEGARYFDLIKAKDEYQPVSNSSEQRSTKRTIGYSLKEYVLPLGVEIVVLAEAAIDPSAEGGIILRRPSKKNMFDRAR
mmetsp:Transcript_6432/g.15864  ORF Transcript_6432/g.15864 Transcript_6432/m.15864 type:complete len:136 (+) Transcript_6432:719-1126(+)